MKYKPRSCIIALAAFLACQTASAQAQTGAPMQLPVLVDGSVTPGQIPDSLAYQHFLTAIAAHPSPTVEEQARQSAQISPTGLSPADRQTLVRSSRSF
jgi:hypothetical protein